MVNTPRERTRRIGKSEACVSEMARREADRQARRIPWKLLLKARRQYVEWNAFSLWVRAITETEGDVPAWLARVLQKRCPGVIASESQGELSEQTPARNQIPLLCRRMSEWIECNVLGHAKQQGWLRAVTYYAVRDPDFSRDCAYWQHCERQWRQQAPSIYPSFEEWRRASEQSSDEILEAFEMPDGRRQIIKASREIGPDRLAEAVAGPLGRTDLTRTPPPELSAT